MSEEVIDRVDQMIRKNNIKYKDQQSQKAYEQALKEYEKHSKAEMAKQYAELVKQGNRKAIEKAKVAKKTQKKTKKKVAVVQAEPVQEVKVVQIPKKRMSEAEVNVVNKTIQARAERIIQEQQLSKLNKKLEQEKKRTKLFQLNEKCKKMLSKSHERIIPAKNVSDEKMGILKKLEDKALGEIGQLDNIINDLIDKANHKGNKASFSQPQQQRVTRQVELKQQQEEQQRQQQQQNSENQQYDEDQLHEDLQFQAQLDQLDNYETNFLDINPLIFQKSSEELLNMDYIPL